MNKPPIKELRRGWTTGACATAAVKAALGALWGGEFGTSVQISLPKGETPQFDLVNALTGEGWAEVGIIKDAGDDPDVTHGCEVRARVAQSTGGVVFKAGEGVGIVTKPGLPIAVGEPAINPKPREMMQGVVDALAAEFSCAPDVKITISIVNGAELALQTWNPRLGIKGGLSVLGTTGIVRPFSCAAWIASIHRGVDVARATGLTHVAGCTGSTSEATVQKLHGLTEGAMLDMGDFAGGLLKYLRRHPVDRITIGGGIGKITKLAQGAVDLHSGRSQVDFDLLADWVGDDRLKHVNTAMEAYDIAGNSLTDIISIKAHEAVKKLLKTTDITPDIVIIDRAGNIIGRAGG